MTDFEEKRMVGDYEIFESFSVGAKEIVMGKNPDAKPDERFLCAYFNANEIAAEYSGMAVSGDYLEILELFLLRLQEETAKLKEALSGPEREGIDDRPVTKEGFVPISYDDDLHGRVVLIKADVLKPEYQRATKQYQLCTSGFGASPHSRGSACFCTNLYDGQSSRFERWDILGTVPPEQMPDWAKAGLERAEKQRKRDRDAR